MTLSWHSNDAQLTFKWRSVDIQMTLSWHSDNIQLTFRWHSVDIQMTLSWHSDDTQLTFRWHSVDIQITLSWHSYDTQLTLSWHSVDTSYLTLNNIIPRTIGSCPAPKRCPISWANVTLSFRIVNFLPCSRPVRAHWLLSWPIPLLE